MEVGWSWVGSVVPTVVVVPFVAAISIWLKLLEFDAGDASTPRQKRFLSVGFCHALKSTPPLLRGQSKGTRIQSLCVCIFGQLSIMQGNDETVDETGQQHKAAEE